MDELDLVRAFRRDDATPSPVAREAARERLVAHIAARQSENASHEQRSRLARRLRAVVPTAPGFQDHDVIYAYYRLKEAGYDVDVATVDGQPVTGRHGVAVPLDRRAKPCIAFEAMAVEHYDIVVLTGGYEAPDQMRQDQEVLDFVAGMSASGKIVAGLSQGPWVMISAGIMRGRRVCAYAGMRDDMINAGADVVDADVMVDGNIVTCSYSGEVGAFMQAVTTLAESDVAARIGESAIA